MTFYIFRLLSAIRIEILNIYIRVSVEIKTVIKILSTQVIYFYLLVPITGTQTGMCC